MVQEKIEAPSPNNDSFPYPIAKMTVGGCETIVTKAEAKDPFATVHFLKGFKSSPYLYEELMHTLTDHGINVVLVTLPDPEDDIDFLEDYEHIARAVFVDGELDNLHDSELPKIAASHSIGGFLLTQLLTQQDEAETIENRYESAFFASPFYGSKYHRLPILRTLAYLYSAFNASAKVGTTWLERQFIAAANDNFHEGEKALANHTQAIYMDSPTGDLMNHINMNGFPDATQKLSMTFHIASQDQVSFNALTKKVANKLDAKLISSIGGHSHIRSTEAGQKILAYEILNTIQKKWLRNAIEAAEKQMIEPEI